MLYNSNFKIAISNQAIDFTSQNYYNFWTGGSIKMQLSSSELKMNETLNMQTYSI